MMVDEATKRLLGRAISDVREALVVLEEKTRLRVLSLADRFALRYAIVQVVEALPRASVPRLRERLVGRPDA